MTREEDVQTAVSLDCWAIGFVLANSPRQVTLQRALELARLAANVITIAVMVDPSEPEVRAALQHFDRVQLHGSESPEFCARFPQGRILKALTPDRLARIPEYEAVLIDAPRPGSGQNFDWTLLRDITAPIILAGGLRPENVARAIAAVRPWAVDVSSGVESAPGVKDPELMRAFARSAGLLVDSL